MVTLGEQRVGPDTPVPPDRRQSPELPAWRDIVAGRLAQRFGGDITVEEMYGQLTVDVPAERWIEALTFARDELDCGFFDWLTGVDELDEGFVVAAHVWSQTRRRHLLVRTTVPRAEPRLPTATPVYRGANWHERETHEMFGVVFDGHPNLVPLLLPDGFEGHPLRKDFVLASRVAKPWPGAKEPGESDADAGHAPRRRRMLPPGVPEDWGPRSREQRDREQADPAEPAREESGQKRPRRDRPQRDRPQRDRPQRERPDREQPDPERPAPERPAPERPAPEQPGQQEGRE